MALLFMDGFDCYANTAQAADGGWSPESGCTINTSGGRFGGGALQFTMTFTQWTKTFPVVLYGAVVYFGFAYKHTGVATAQLVRLISDTTAALIILSHNASGNITLQPSAGANTSEAGNSLTPGSWHWIEVKVTLGTTSSNGAVEVKVNGSTVINATSQDTNSTGSGASVIELGAGGASNPNEAYIDDVVIYDATGSTVNDFLGDTKITTHSPTADAATVDWTASAGSDFQCVDETPNAANDDTDYISSSTAGQESRFAMGNLADTPSAIHGVQVRYRAKKTDAGDRTVRSLINSSASESVGNTRGLPTLYRWFYGDFFPLDPNGSIAWTDTTINALEVGVEVVT